METVLYGNSGDASGWHRIRHRIPAPNSQLVIIPLVVFGLIFGALYAVAEVNSRPFQWRIVAQDERREAHGRVMTFGYRIEKSSYGAEAYRLTIYGDTFSHFFIAKPVDLVRIVKQNWLCQDRVLYLHLETKYVDSGFPPVTPLKILYDFETLELSMHGQNGEWSPRPREYRLARTITEAEFDRRPDVATNACPK